MPLERPVRGTLLVFEVELRKGSSPGFLPSLSEDWASFKMAITWKAGENLGKTLMDFFSL